MSETKLGTLTPSCESKFINNLCDGISKKDWKPTYPTDDVSSSFFERVTVIIDTCLVVSKLQDEQW